MNIFSRPVVAGLISIILPLAASASVLDFTCKVSEGNGSWVEMNQSGEGSRELVANTSNYEIVIDNFVDDIFKAYITDKKTGVTFATNSRPVDNTRIGLQLSIKTDRINLLNVNCKKN